MSDMVLYEPNAAMVQAKGVHYTLNTERGEVELKRNVDFGLIPGTKKPSLYKPGAEKVIFSYGLIARYHLETAIEDMEAGRFFYRFKCLLIGLRDGQELCVAEGYGSANTMEKRNGFAAPHDIANSTLKMAKKRAMVDAALMVGRLSAMFSQDIEDEAFMDTAKPIEADASKPDGPITSKQRQRIFAIGSTNGLSTEKTREIINSLGFVKTSDVKQKDYDRVCEAVEKGGTQGASNE